MIREGRYVSDAQRSGQRDGVGDEPLDEVGLAAVRGRSVVAGVSAWASAGARSEGGGWRRAEAGFRGLTLVAGVRGGGARFLAAEAGMV